MHATRRRGGFSCSRGIGCRCGPAQQPSGSKEATPEDPKELTAGNTKTVRDYGAVEGALYWLGKHQNKDGSWSFANSGRPGEPTWANPGTWTSKQGVPAWSCCAT